MLRHERFVLVDMGNVGPMLEKLSHKAELVSNSPSQKL